MDDTDPITMTGPMQETQSESGQHTSEYRKVLKNYHSLIRVINNNPCACESLGQKFKEEEWLMVEHNPTAEELIKIVLLRVELAAKNFKVFTAMNVIGMDQINGILTAQTQDSSVQPRFEPDSGMVKDASTGDNLQMKQPNSLDAEHENSHELVLGSRGNNSLTPQSEIGLASSGVHSGGTNVNSIPDVGNIHQVSSEGTYNGRKTMGLESDDGEARMHAKELVGHKKSTSPLAMADVPVSDCIGSISTTDEQQGMKPVDAVFQSNAEESQVAVGFTEESDTEEDEGRGQPYLQHSSSCAPQPEVTKESQSEKGQAMVYQRVQISPEYVVMSKLEIEALRQGNQQLHDEYAHCQRKQCEECLISLRAKDKHLAMLKCDKTQRIINIKQDEYNRLMDENCSLKVSLAEVKAEVTCLKKDLEIARSLKWYDVFPYFLICMLVLYAAAYTDII